MKNKTTLSIALATYNEQHNIEALLKNIVDFADEIVIVDGESTDKTTSLAQKYKKVKLISTPNTPVFHINKNKAIDACTSDWILQLDADERLTPELKQEIQKILTEGTKHNGFWLPRSNYFLGTFLKKGGQYPDATLRLYRRGLGRLPAKDVHEQATVIGTVGNLKNPLLHYADVSFSRYLLRHNRYTTILAKQFQEQGVSLSFASGLNYYLIKPIYEFFLIYLRHRGYVDGFAGFVFAFYSALRFPIAFTKYYELIKTRTKVDLNKDWDKT